jgi:hypothetical protein
VAVLIQGAILGIQQLSTANGRKLIKRLIATKSPGGRSKQKRRETSEKRAKMGLTEPEVPITGVWNEAERKTKSGRHELARAKAFKSDAKRVDEMKKGV